MIFIIYTYHRSGVVNLYFKSEEHIQKTFKLCLVMYMYTHNNNSEEFFFGRSIAHSLSLSTPQTAAVIC